MRIPVAIESPISTWLLSTDDVDARNLALAQLKDSILFARPEAIPEIMRFLKGQSLEASLLTDFINENVCFSDAGCQTATFQLNQVANSNGVLIRSASNSEFARAKKRYFNPNSGESSPERVFARYFKSHLSTATKITFIDCFAALQICDPNSAVSRLLQEVLLRQSGLDITIHCRLIASRPDLKRINPLSLSGHDLKVWLDSFGTDFMKMQSVVDKSFLNALEAMLGLAETCSNRLEIVFHEYNNFPHDRHVEVAIPSGISGNRTVSDYFALGNGFETFAITNVTSTNSRPAQIYSSDQSRMWTGKHSWYGKRAQWIVVDDARDFKNSTSPLSFIRPSNIRK